MIQINTNNSRTSQVSSRNFSNISNSVNNLNVKHNEDEKKSSYDGKNNKKILPMKLIEMKTFL